MKVYIVHGYNASPSSHWFPWLQQALSEIGVVCDCLTMPDSAHPTPDSWLSALSDKVRIDENTVVVGHSLGCIALMNFLARNYEKPAGAVFVSGFFEPLDNLPELTIFSNVYAVSPPLMPFPSYVVASLDDTVVPHRYSDELAKHLNAEYIRLPKGGHFLGCEGYTEFPLVFELVRKLLKL